MKVLVIQKVLSHELRQPQVVQSMFGSTEPHFASVPATFGASTTRGRVKNLFNIKYFHGHSWPCPHQWRPRSGNGKVSLLIWSFRYRLRVATGQSLEGDVLGLRW